MIQSWKLSASHLFEQVACDFKCSLRANYIASDSEHAAAAVPPTNLAGRLEILEAFHFAPLSCCMYYHLQLEAVHWLLETCGLKQQAPADLAPRCSVDLIQPYSIYSLQAQNQDR